MTYILGILLCLQTVPGDTVLTIQDGNIYTWVDGVCIDTTDLHFYFHSIKMLDENAKRKELEWTDKHLKK